MCIDGHGADMCGYLSDVVYLAGDARRHELLVEAASERHAAQVGRVPSCATILTRRARRRIGWLLLVLGNRLMPVDDLTETTRTFLSFSHDWRPPPRSARTTPDCTARRVGAQVMEASTTRRSHRGSIAVSRRRSDHRNVRRTAGHRQPTIWCSWCLLYCCWRMDQIRPGRSDGRRNHKL